MECNLEICCADIESVIAAANGGADRIELCTALEEGGLTPSSGLVRKAVDIMGGERVNVLIRPRPGNFVYSPAEMEVVEEDIRAAVEAGTNGIVFGALDSSGKIDVDLCKNLRARFPDVVFTFHRAFDLVDDPYEALEAVADMHFDRILTSGLSRDAEEGIAVLAGLCKEANGRISIMAGCGINESNVRRILRETGVRDIHASAKIKVGKAVSSRHRDVRMGVADNGERFVTSESIVRNLKNLSRTEL